MIFLLYLIENNTKYSYSPGICKLHQWAIECRRFQVIAFVRNVEIQLPRVIFIKNRNVGYTAAKTSRFAQCGG
jgi:hypothetical protein